MPLVLRVHKYAPKRTIFDQMADCLSSLGQWENPADCRLERAFLQELEEGSVSCGYRLLGEELEREPADRCGLPYDVGNVDLRFSSSRITGNDYCPTEGERCERLASQFSAYAIDDDVDTLAFGNP